MSGFSRSIKTVGGVLVAGQREIGRTIGWSKNWTNEVLYGLAAAGLVKLSTGKSGR